MACPNCNHENIEYDDMCALAWGLFVSFSGCQIFTQIDYCPFCGEQLLSPSEACARGCDG